jgi:hypothetical protein
MWNLCFSCPNYQKRTKIILKPQVMKAVITSLMSKKGIVMTLVVSAFVLTMLPSCKHSGGTCDAYQGSTRSVKAHKHHH